MFKFISGTLDGLIMADQPWKNILIAFIIAIIICVSVIAIGFIVEKFNKLQIKLLTKIMSTTKALFIVNRVTFIGTILHELAHALLTWATGATIQKMKLLTFFDAHRLGYVTFCPKGNKFQQHVQLSLISCAPVLLGMVETHLILLALMQAIPIWLKLILIYIGISIITHMAMSDADIKNYLRGLIMVFPLIFVIAYALKLFVFV